MSEPTNNERASWANTALSAFANEFLLSPGAEEDEVLAGDLLANLMHLCDAQSWSFENLLESAREHYAAEIREQPKADCDFAS